MNANDNTKTIKENEEYIKNLLDNFNNKNESDNNNESNI